jgi:hypothetical protein
MCVAKLFSPSSRGGSIAGGSSSAIVGPGGHNVVKCEASRNLKWHITQTGIQVRRDPSQRETSHLFGAMRD